MTHLWVEGPAPEEWVGVVLGREFGRYPWELADAPYEAVVQTVAMLGVEARVNEKKREQAAQLRKLGLR